MKRKNYIKALLSFMLILTVLVGCGYQASAGETDVDWVDGTNEISDVSVPENAKDSVNTEVETPFFDNIDDTEFNTVDVESPADLDMPIDEEKAVKPLSTDEKPSGADTKEATKETKADGLKDSAKKDVKVEGKSVNSPLTDSVFTVNDVIIEAWETALAAAPPTMTSFNVPVGTTSVVIDYTKSHTNPLKLNIGAATGAEIKLTHTTGTNSVELVGASGKTLEVANQMQLNKFTFGSAPVVNVTLKTSGTYTWPIAKLVNPGFIAADNLTLNSNETGNIALNGKTVTLSIFGTYTTTGNGTINPTAGSTLNVAGTVAVTGTGEITVNTGLNADVVTFDKGYKVTGKANIKRIVSTSNVYTILSTDNTLAVDTDKSDAATNITPNGDGKTITVKGSVNIEGDNSVIVDTTDTKAGNIINFLGTQSNGFNVTGKAVTKRTAAASAAFTVTAKDSITVNTKGIKGNTEINLGTITGKTVKVENENGAATDKISIIGNEKENTIDLTAYTGKVDTTGLTPTTKLVVGANLTISDGDLSNLNLDNATNPDFTIILDKTPTITTGMKIKSDNTTKLTIKGTGLNTLTGTSDVSGMIKLADLIIDNAVGSQTVIPPKSTGARGSGTASPFTNLTINGVGAGVSDVKIDTDHTGANVVENISDVNVIPNFSMLKITGVVTGLTSIDISNCGIESTSLPITVTGASALKLDISGNGFNGSGNFSFSNVKNIETLTFKNNPNKFKKWAGPDNLTPASSFTIDGDKIGTALATVDLSYSTTITNPTSTHVVTSITYKTKVGLHTDVATKSHSALTISINDDKATNHTITGNSSNISLLNNGYTKWPDDRFNNTGTIGSTFSMKNDAIIDLASGSLNTNTNETGKAPTIVFESAFSSAPSPFVHNIAGNAINLTFGDKSLSASDKYNLTGTGSSALTNLTFTENSVTAIKELTYDGLKFNTGKLPTVSNWKYETSATDKKLTLNNNNLSNLGDFKGSTEDSGKYFSSRGYNNLNIVEIKGTNPIAYLNLRDQATTLHTLDFKDKAALLEYNLNGCNQLLNGSTTTTKDALAEVFNVENGKLQKIDYSGCTQLAVGGGLDLTGSETLKLHGNAITTAYLGNIEDIININLYKNNLTLADAVTDMPNSSNTDIAGLYFGATGTNFEGTDKTLDISGNQFTSVKLSARVINGDELYNTSTPRALGMKNLLIAKNKVDITNGVFVSDELNLTDVHLGDTTVQTQLNLSHNEKLENLWGTPNTHTGATEPTPGAGGAANTGFNLSDILDLTNSKLLYGKAPEKFIIFNNDTDNKHAITHAFLDGMDVENVQINDNKTLLRISLRDPVTGTIIKNLELSNNELVTVDSTSNDVKTSSVVLPSATQIEGIIRLDTNPINKINIIDYGKLTFVSVNNSAKPQNLAGAKNKLAPGAIKNVIAGGITITNKGISASTLTAIDIHSNEVHNLILNNNPALESIFGTLSVDAATSIDLYTGITNTIFTTYPMSKTGTSETSMIVGMLDLSKTAKIPTEIIFRGHLIKEANLSEASFDKIDLRRNNGEGETRPENESPLYMVDLKDKHGVLEKVNISDNKGKPISSIYLDENILKKIDSTKTTDTDMIAKNVKFSAGAVLTVNKNFLTDVTIIKSANNNADALVEVQLNDNELVNINFTNMENITTLLVNRTIEGKNMFTDGIVILNNTNKLEMFAPVTLVQKDKTLDDRVSRRKPNRPNEYRWEVEKTVNDGGLSFTLDYIPEDAFMGITVPTPAKFNDVSTTTAPEAGFYTYVPIKKLDVLKAAKLLTLRVPGNHLTDGTMSLNATAGELKFIDISGSHNLTTVDGEYAFPGTGKIQDDYFYKQRSGSIISPSGAYKDPNSGKLGAGKAFVSVWPKAEHIYFYNNQYTSFDIGSSANSAITVLAHNNHMTHVNVEKGAKLQVLDVERNIISPTIVLPKNLLIIRAGYNLISKYPNTPEVPTLQEIYLNHNSFPEKSIVSEIKSNPNLKVLNVSVNNFLHLPELSSNSKLEELYAYRNQIETLPKLAPAGMKVLDLNHNKLVQIIYALPDSVRYLDVSDNLFKDLDIPNIPSGMASTDNTIVAHEVRPSHIDDIGPGLVNPPVGFEGTLNIRHNQIPNIPKNYHDAWADYFNNNPTKIGHFYLEYNLLNIDVYDPNNRDYMTGTQKWLASKEPKHIFIVTATYTDRHIRVVPYLSFYHPGRKTHEKVPGYHNYDIWFPGDVETKGDIIDHLKTILTNATLPMYARVVSKGYQPPVGSKNPVVFDDIKGYTYTFRGFTFDSADREKTPRNNIAEMFAELYKDVSYPSEFPDSKTDSGKKVDGKDGSKIGGKYNPTTGPR